MTDVVINGRVLLLPTNGIPRYAAEIMRYIDKNMPEGMNIEVVIPKGASARIEFKSIKYVILPNRFAWDYTEAERYAKKKQALYINMASKGVLYKNSISTVFDIRPISYEPKPTDFKSLKYYFKFRISFYLASKNSKHLVTISKFCKKEILKYCNRKENELSIIGCGWDHIKNIFSDESIFIEYPNICKGEYYLSIGSVAPHKNFKWIVNNAAFNSNTQYVIVGKTDPSLWKDTTSSFGGNVIYIGYQSDEKVKALICNSKALIFPSLYEGFGIPPIEALGCGVKAIVSDIPVMHELFGDGVSYIDPMIPQIKMTDIAVAKQDDVKLILDKYLWEKQGKKWIDLLKTYSSV